MATLTETALLVRKLGKLAIIGIFLAVILKIIISAGISYWVITHPKPLSPPTVSFGKLPSIRFPKERGVRPQTFNLETIEGRVPEATPQARVFFISKKLPSLMASAKARQFAQRLGFKDEPTQETQTRFRFKDKDYPARTLSLDIIDNNFSLKYDLSVDPQAGEGKLLLTPEEAVSEAKSFFQGVDSLPNELATGKNSVSFFKIIGGKFEETSSLTDAQVLRVDFFKKELDGKPILPPYFDKSHFYVVIGNSQDLNKKILEAGYNNWPVEGENWATYPLKISQTTWEELKNGGGFIARLGQNKETVTIRRIYLAYYDSEETQSYLQPIFVFEGDNNFVAYVPATDPAWIE